MPNTLWGGIAPDGEEIALIQRDGETNMWVINHDLELYTLPSKEITLTGKRYKLREVD